MECVLELFCKYLEKCLWEHLFELCFSLSHGKKYCLNKCSKICSTPNIVLHALPSGVVSSYVTLRKEESQQKNFSQVRNETEQFPLSFFWYWGKEESVRTLLGKGSSKGIQANSRNRVYKTPIFWGHVLYGWGFIKYVPQEFWSFIYPVL